MVDRKPNDRYDVRELSDTPREPLEESSNKMEDVPETTTSSLLDTQESCRSGRIVRTLGQFMFIGEAFSNELDLNPSSYNDVISNKDSKN